MPLPPTVVFERTAVASSSNSSDNEHHPDGFTMKRLHPCVFPMVVGRLYAMEGNKSMQNSWSERHFQHCQAILEEIHECEAKMAELSNKLVEETLGVHLIEEIEDCMSWSDDESSHEQWYTAHDSYSYGMLSDDSSPHSSSSSLDTEPSILLPEIPTSVLGRVLAPLIPDRHTFDSLAATCTELFNACASMNQLPPWPEGLIRVGVGFW